MELQSNNDVAFIPDIFVAGESAFTKNVTFKKFDKTIKKYGLINDFSSLKGRLKFIVEINSQNLSQLIDQLKFEKNLMEDYMIDNRISGYNHSTKFKMEIVIKC